jgi:translation elongation factor P/translation initiation factor 5A
LKRSRSSASRYFEYENAPYHCLDVEVSKPTARGGQTLVRLKMRNLLTRAVFDKTFKRAKKFGEPGPGDVGGDLYLQRRRRLFTSWTSRPTRR